MMMLAALFERQWQRRSRKTLAITKVSQGAYQCAQLDWAAHDQAASDQQHYNNRRRGGSQAAIEIGLSFNWIIWAHTPAGLDLNQPFVSLILLTHNAHWSSLLFSDCASSYFQRQKSNEINLASTKKDLALELLQNLESFTFVDRIFKLIFVAKNTKKCNRTKIDWTSELIDLHFHDDFGLMIDDSANRWHT